MDLRAAGTRWNGRRVTILDALGLVVRLGVAAVWLISGIAKASDSLGTIVAVQAFRILPNGAVRPVAATLPYLEIALGVLLLVGLAVRLTAVISALVLVIYIGAVISAAARGLSIDCGCFGGGGAVSSGQTHYQAEILRDVGFLLLAVYLVWRPRSLLSVDALVAGRWDRGDVDDDDVDDAGGADDRGRTNGAELDGGAAQTHQA